MAFEAGEILKSARLHDFANGAEPFKSADGTKVKSFLFIGWENKEDATKFAREVLKLKGEL